MDDAFSLSFSSPPATSPADDPLAPGDANDERAVYLVGRRDGRAAGWLEALSTEAPILVEPPARALEADAVPGLVLIVAEDLSAPELLDLLARVARGRGEWLPATLSRDESGSAVARPVSLGYTHPLSETVEANGTGEDRPLILEFRRVLDRISRARHDLNNPLTSALAETQLLLMDVTDPESREALETVQRQLRRMRDMIQELRPLRFADG